MAEKSTAKYVKFIRGSKAAFEKLITKYDDTLYFIYGEDESTGSLYLGDRLIANGDATSQTAIDTLAELLDVNIEDVEDGMLLGYSAALDQWIPMDIRTLVSVSEMTGATAETAGIAGTVPAPKAGDQDKFLAGDGKWRAVPVPIISSVSNDFTITAAKQLVLNDIGIAKVTGLQDALNGKVDALDGWTLLSPTDKKKLDALVVDGEGGLEISGTVNAANVEELDEWITNHRNSVLGLYPTADATKLASVETGAQKNFITSVEVGVFTVTNGLLTLDEVPTDRVAGLSELQATVNAFPTTYVSNTVFNTRVGTLENTISTIETNIIELNDRMKWQDLAE